MMSGASSPKRQSPAGARRSTADPAPPAARSESLAEARGHALTSIDAPRDEPAHSSLERLVGPHADVDSAVPPRPRPKLLAKPGEAQHVGLDGRGIHGDLDERSGLGVLERKISFERGL